MAYSKVERRIHDDERFRRWTRDVRQMWQYLLTTKHGNRLGLFVLDPLYAAADLSAPDDRWTEERVMAALLTLATEGRIAHDPDARLVLLYNHLEHNAPENPNVVKGALSELAELPFSPRLFPLFLEVIRRHCRDVTERGEPFAALWVEAVSERIREAAEGGAENQSPHPSYNGLENRSANHSTNGSVNGMPNPEPLPEPEPYPPTGGDAREARTPAHAHVREDAQCDLDPEPTRKGRRAPLVDRPVGWAPTDAHRAKAAADGIDIDHEADQFCAYHDAKGNRFRSWNRAFDTWLGNAKRFGGRGGSGASASTPSIDSTSGEARYAPPVSLGLPLDDHDEQARNAEDREARLAAWAVEMDDRWEGMDEVERESVEREVEAYSRTLATSPAFRARSIAHRRREIVAERIGELQPAGAR